MSLTDSKFLTVCSVVAVFAEQFLEISLIILSPLHNLKNRNMIDVIVLYEGYSTMTGKDQMVANCSCILITGKQNVIVDTMTAWDSEKIITGY